PRNEIGVFDDFSDYEEKGGNSEFVQDWQPLIDDVLKAIVKGQQYGRFFIRAKQRRSVREVYKFADRDRGVVLNQKSDLLSQEGDGWTRAVKKLGICGVGFHPVPDYRHDLGQFHS